MQCLVFLVYKPNYIHFMGKLLQKELFCFVQLTAPSVLLSQCGQPAAVGPKQQCDNMSLSGHVAILEYKHIP